MRFTTPKALTIATIFWAFTAVSAFSMCRDDKVELRGNWGKAQFRVEIADTVEERAVGLMNRSSMATSAGMLFIYQKPGPLSFWMRNTLIPLDMLFLDQQGIVRNIHENAVPLDDTPIYGGKNLLAVLEINGGLARKLGITVGSELRHPALPQSFASWPCKAN